MTSSCVKDFPRAKAALVLLCALLAPVGAQAQTPAQGGAGGQPPRDSVIPLEGVGVMVGTGIELLTPVQRLTLPAAASIGYKKVEQTVNLLDTEDAVKYLPSIFLRKRNNGDTQAVMGTRVWGVSSSARSLVIADGIPLSALIANNNTIGGPRWGLVAPAEIERIDVMYGPYSAAYAGNSMGAVMEITTRLPEEGLEGSVSHTLASQAFNLYGTDKSLATNQTALNLGLRQGRASVWLNANYQDSHSQPLGFATAATFPTNTTGGFSEQNKLGAPANVLGATGLLHTRMSNLTVKASYDLTSALRASYRFGFWENDAESDVETYLQRSGDATYAAVSGFASGASNLLQQHTAHALSLRSDTKSDWDFEAVATRYSFDDDKQRTPTAAPANGTTFGQTGRVALYDGTGWSTVDVRGVWRPGGLVANHAVSVGAHEDHYELANPTYATADWTDPNPVLGALATEGSGKTRTRALWFQDAWRMLPDLKLTAGGRLESWRAYDGRNVNGATAIDQQEADATRFSPKAVVTWNATPDLTLTASAAKAYRFPTASELYQLVSTGTTFTSPAPDLKPDNVTALELRAERRGWWGRAQVALFQDDVHDAIISQFLPLVPNSPTLYSYVSNVDLVRARGVEVLATVTDVLVPRLEVTGTVTYLKARTLALSGASNATAASGDAVGKRLPNIPDWRANFVTSYRPVEALSVSLGGRYSGMVYTTLDNADVYPGTYGGFEKWFVMDAKANYRLGSHLSMSAGVDNLLDRKYFWFHPFPQRTLVGELKVNF